MTTPPPPPPPPPPGSMPPPPPPPSGGLPGGGLQPVGPWPRFGAHFIDGLVLLVPQLILGVIIGVSATGFRSTTGAASLFAGLLGVAMTLAYAVWLETSRGQTVGKMALGIRVLAPEGGNPTPEQALKRNAWLLLGVVPYLGGLAQIGIMIAIGVTISNDSFKRGIHDNFAGGTAVVRSR